MAATSTIKSSTLAVPGGNLYFEVRGSGPVLLMMPGGPADATTFRKIEDSLAADHTVVTYDPRGISRSSTFDPGDDSRMVEIFADDVHRSLASFGESKASVFASSGGAVIALELAKRHPDQLVTVVVHEPPSPELQADPARVQAAMEDVCDTYASGGLWPALQKFMALVRIEGVPAVGAESQGQLAHDGGLALAAKLGVEAAVFPGDHSGFEGRPAEFAGKLSDALGG
jgi:pimeloyl-ACP methyl ester carboxylesterase